MKAEVAMLLARHKEASRARLALEKRVESRAAAQAELRLIQLQAARRLQGKTRARSAAQDQRSRTVLMGIENALGRISGFGNREGKRDVRSRSEKTLEEAKEQYKEHVDRMYPRFEEELEKQAVKHLRKLERMENDARRRRMLAAKAFEKEKALREMVAEKEHEVKLAREKERAALTIRERERKALERSARERALHRGANSEIFPQEEEEDEEQSFQFKLSYEWQPVPLGGLLPSQAEQKLDDEKGHGRLARIPDEWSLSCTVDLDAIKYTCIVRVDKEDTIRKVVEKISQQCGLEPAEILLRCNDSRLDIDRNVKWYGGEFFQGSVSAQRQNCNLSSFTLEKSQNWSRLNTILNECFKEVIGSVTLQQELRSSKYGILRRGENDESFGEEKGETEGIHSVLKQLRNINDTKLVLNQQTNISLIPNLIKAFLREECVGLIPLTAKDSNAIQKYHQACGDGRELVWLSLQNHWRWLTRERILSKNEIASAFAEPLLAPGEDDGDALETIKGIILSVWDGGNQEMRKQLSYDELLGGHTSKPPLTVSASRASNSLVSFLSANQPDSKASEAEEEVGDDEFDF